MKSSPTAPQNHRLFFRGEDFYRLSLDIHATLFKKKWRMSGFEVEKGELGEKSAVFSNGENRRETGRRSVQNGLFAVLRWGIPANGESSQVPHFHSSCGKRKSPLTGKPSMGRGKSDGRTRRGDLEPFSSVLQSLTCDLFESEPSGERKPLFSTSGKRLERSFRP